LEALRWVQVIGVPQVVVADALADGVRGVAQVAGARGGSPEVLARQVGMPPWKVKKVRGISGRWSLAGLTSAMSTVAELNAAVKGQAADADFALEKAVIAVVRAARMS